MSEEKQNSKAGNTLGIVGLVLGICALVLSFVPCLGMYAMYPGILAIILSGIAFMQAKKENAPNGLIIAAIVVSILGTGIAVYQYTVLQQAVAEIEEGFSKGLKDLESDLKDTIK